MPTPKPKPKEDSAKEDEEEEEEQDVDDMLELLSLSDKYHIEPLKDAIEDELIR